MIHDGPYPEGDPRRDFSAWLCIFLPHLSIPIREGIHEALASAKLLEAHHGEGTPVMNRYDASGEHLGHAIYIRAIEEQR